MKMISLQSVSTSLSNSKSHKAAILSSKYLVFILLSVLIIMISELSLLSSCQSTSDGSYLSQARKLFDTGMEAHQQSQTYSSLLPNEDPRAARMLRDSINKATELINNYRQNGLSSLPNLPNLPGVNTLMRIPDKLLRAELSMLQDEIRMAQQMMENPITATVNAPRDLASMFSRMAEQLEQ